MTTFKRILKPLTAVVCFFVTWQFLMVSEYIAWAKTPAKPQTQGHTSSTAEKHAKTLGDLEETVKNLRTGLTSGADVSSHIKKLKTHASDLDTHHAAIEAEFVTTSKKLEEIHASPEILARQEKALSDYRKKHGELKGLLQTLDQHKSKKDDLTKDADDLLFFLQANKPKSRHIPLDPNKLPHRAIKAKQILPKQTQDEYDKDERFNSKTKPQHGWNQILPKEGVKFASASGDLTGMFQVAQATPTGGIPAPIPDDLAPTIDAQFTDGIRAKAAELGNQPLPIYQWVRNNIEFVPTYGSIQGADYCLQTKQCNAFDTSSLLIALLRISGISARYVYGTIEIPADKAMNWVGGVQKPELAVELMNMGGIPAVAVLEGSQITKIRLEHIWVEAFVDYIPSRGAVHRQGDTWIPMDASWKQYTYTDGIDIAAAVPFDAQGFVDHITSNAMVNQVEGWATGIDSTYISQQMDAYNTQVANYFSQNLPNATVADVLGSKTIVTQSLPILASVLPYKKVSLGGRYSGLVDSWRGTVTFSLPAIPGSDGSAYSTSFPTIAGKRVTLSFAPASPADEALIASFLPKPHADGTPLQLTDFPQDYPAYLINLKPELRVDGAVVAIGAPEIMGASETMSIALDVPGIGPDLIEKKVAVGEYFGVGLETGRVGTATLDAYKARIGATKAKLEAQNYAGLTKEDLLGDLLSTTIATYFGELGALDTVAARNRGIVNYRTPSVGLTADEKFIRSSERELKMSSFHFSFCCFLSG